MFDSITDALVYINALNSLTKTCTENGTRQHTGRETWLAVKIDLIDLSLVHP